MKKYKKFEQKLLYLLVILLPTQLSLHLWPPSAFIRGVRIDYLSPTIYFTDIVLAGLLLFWASRSEPLKALKKKLMSIRLLAGLSALVIINIFLSSNRQISVYQWLRLAALALFFVYIKSTSKKTRSRMLKLLPIPIIYSALIALTQFFKQGSAARLLYWLGERSFTLSTPGIAKANIMGNIVLRPYATLPHPNALAGFLLTSLCLASLFFAFKKSSGYFNLLLIISLILSAASIFLTFSLSAWIALALVVAIYALAKLDRARAPVVGAAVLTAAIMVFLFPPEASSLTGRLEGKLAAFKMMQKSPVFGVGLGNYIPKLLDIEEVEYSAQSPFLVFQPVHNIYALIAAETGLIGLAAFWVLLLKALISAKQKKANHLLLALISILSTGLFDHYWLTLQQTRLLFTLVLALSFKK